MLKHEPEQTAAQIPAAERRVSAEELTRAVTALEEAKAAELQAGVAPIGQVVEELGLESTPEEIWAQVEKQRAEQSVPKPQVQPVSALQNPKIGRQMRRGWRGMRGWVWIVFWCTGGFGLLAGLPHLLHHSAPVVAASGQRITISGDSVTEEVNAQGKDVVISGDSDKITLHGEARSLTVDGDGDMIIADTADTASIAGDGDTVKWTSTPPSDLSDPSHRERLPSKGTP